MSNKVNNNATRHIALTTFCGAFAISVKILTGNNEIPGGYTMMTVVSSPIQKIRMMKNEVNSQYRYTNITAPISGVITAKYANQGDLANPAPADQC